MTAAWQPYCGVAPLPSEWLSRWNWDPILLSAMAALALGHAMVLWRSGEFRSRGWWYASLWLIAFTLFVSPLCALSSALFSVRVVHHVLLIAVAAPLAVLSLPRRWRSVAAQSAGVLGVVFALHVAIVWVWHLPAPYASALSSDPVFWIMQLSLLGSAIALWRLILSPAGPAGAALSLTLGTVMQMGLLGAMITFARSPLYVPHFATTEPFGLSPLADQQLAGLIMWVPATLPYLAVALILIGRSLARAANADTVA
jgi:putative membrane protein